MKLNLKNLKPVIYPTYDDDPLRPVLVDTDRKTPLPPRFMYDRYNALVLQNNPNAVFKMNEPDCTYWIDTLYHNVQHAFFDIKGEQVKVRMAPIRQLVKKRRSDIRKAQKDYNQYKNLELNLYHLPGIINQFVVQIINDTQFTLEHHLNRCPSLSRTFVFDLSNINSGLYSVRGLEQEKKNKSFKYVNEHCYPRTIAMRHLIRDSIEMYHKGTRFSEKEIIMRWAYYCFTTNTTKYENNKLLKPWQNDETFVSPEDSYYKAGIHLVRKHDPKIPWQWHSLFKRYDIDVNQIEFPDFSKMILPYSDVLEALGD